jgi:hypothetical protein
LHWKNQLLLQVRVRSYFRKDLLQFELRREGLIDLIIQEDSVKELKKK